MDFQLSKTYANLQNAIEHELMDSTKFLSYSIKAMQEGYIEIGTIFDTASRNERIHSETFQKLQNNGYVSNTYENLNEASNISSYKGNTLYREYAQIARDEGYDNIAAIFEGIANIELNHDLYFHEQAVNIANNQVFCKSNEVLWICLSCGNILGGNCAPEICPVCGFPQGYYQVYNP